MALSSPSAARGWKDAWSPPIGRPRQGRLHPRSRTGPPAHLRRSDRRPSDRRLRAPRRRLARQDAAKVGAGAALGAIIGAIAGGGKGAAIGAGVGGGAGAGDVMATRGKPAALPSETRVTFRLQRPSRSPKSCAASRRFSSRRAQSAAPPAPRRATNTECRHELLPAAPGRFPRRPEDLPPHSQHQHAVRAQARYPARRRVRARRTAARPA